MDNQDADHDINWLVHQNEELKNENFSLKEANMRMIKLINCFEQIKNLLIPIISQCKCENSVKTQNIKKLNQLLNELKNENKNEEKIIIEVVQVEEEQIKVKKENVDDEKQMYDVEEQIYDDNDEEKKTKDKIELISSNDNNQMNDEKLSPFTLNFDVNYDNESVENINKDSKTKERKIPSKREREKIKLPSEEVDIDDVKLFEHNNNPDFELSDKSKRTKRKKKLKFFFLKQDEEFSSNDDIDKDPDFRCENEQLDDLKEVLKKRPKKYKKSKIGRPLKRPEEKKPPKKRINVPGNYRCDWPGCDQVYKYKSGLFVHKFRHTGQAKYICQLCHKEYVLKTHYDGHMRSHTNEKLTCDWPGCEFKCNFYQSLDRHKLIHAQIKKYICEWENCGKSFRNKHELKAHNLSHTGEKPYQCEITGCQRRFQSRQTMRFHLERHHHVKSNISQSNQENSKDNKSNKQINK